MIPLRSSGAHHAVQTVSWQFDAELDQLVAQLEVMRNAEIISSTAR